MKVVRIGHCIAKFIRDDSGSTAIEYGLIAAMLSITIIASLKAIRTQLTSWMAYVVNELTAAVPN